MIINPYMVIASSGGNPVGQYHKWWRLLITDMSTSIYAPPDYLPYKIAEIEFFQPFSGDPISISGNAFSSSIYAPTEGDFLYDYNAFDDDPETCWGPGQSAAFETCFIGYHTDFGGGEYDYGMQVVGVRIKSAGDSGSQGEDSISATIQVQSSDDTTNGTDGTWLDEFSGVITNTWTPGDYYNIGAVP